MRTYGGESLDELLAMLFPSELNHRDPIGDKVFVRNRVAAAIERFDSRKDDWAAAEALARDIAKGDPTRALVAHVYRRIREEARSGKGGDAAPITGQKAQGSPPRSSSKRGKQRKQWESELEKTAGLSARQRRRKARRGPSLEDLERDRREAERKKVKDLPKGKVKKNLL